MPLRNYRIGSIVTDTVEDLKSIGAHASASKYDTFETDGAKYSVTGGKILYIAKILVLVGTAGARIKIGYADNSISNATGPPTNPVILGGDEGVITHSNNAGAQPFDVFYAIPAGKYPFILMDAGGTGSVQAFCQEI